MPNGGGARVRLKKRAKGVEEFSRQSTRSKQNFFHAAANGAHPRSRHEHNEESCRQERSGETQKPPYADRGHPKSILHSAGPPEG